MEKLPPEWSDNELWPALKSSRSIPCTNLSPYFATLSQDFSGPTTSSSANTLSSSTEIPVGNKVAESSTTESLEVEFVKDKEFLGHKPPDEATKTTLAAAVAPDTSRFPTWLFIETELCREKTLHHWLRENIRNRPKKTVFNYFSQVNLVDLHYTTYSNVELATFPDSPPDLNRESLGTRLVWNVDNQILEAVVYIHEKGLVHRNLKPSNIFFSCEDDTLKVGDFGLVTGNIAANAPSTNLPRPEGQSCSNVAFYMSPEQRAELPIQQNQAQKIDMFAVGVIFFELCCPFTTEMERYKVLTNLENLENPKFPPRFMDKLYNEAELIRMLLVPEPSHRPTAEHTQKCELMKRLRKIAKKSHDYVPMS